MTGMDDLERQSIHGDLEMMEKKRLAKIDHETWCLGGVLCVAFLCAIVLGLIFQTNAHYYVSVDSVSPSTDPTRGLSFNLTLGVSSWSYGAKACIKPGAYVEVSYRGVQLAVSEAETERLCVGPMKSADRRVTARVTVVPVGQVLDRLRMDMKERVAVFNVTLHLPAWSYGSSESFNGESCVSECGGMPVGAANVWCVAPEQMPPKLEADMKEAAAVFQCHIAPPSMVIWLVGLV